MKSWDFYPRKLGIFENLGIFIPWILPKFGNLFPGIFAKLGIFRGWGIFFRGMAYDMPHMICGIFQQKATSESVVIIDI